MTHLKISECPFTSVFLFFSFLCMMNCQQDQLVVGPIDMSGVNFLSITY